MYLERLKKWLEQKGGKTSDIFYLNGYRRFELLFFPRNIGRNEIEEKIIVEQLPLEFKKEPSYDYTKYYYYIIEKF